MPGISSIMQSLFGTTPAVAAPTPPANPGPGNTQNNTGPAPGTASSPQTDNNGVVPKTEEAKAPLSDFKEIWQNDPKATPPETVEALFANFDPAKVQESAGKVDFSKSITPDVLAKVSKGGEEGTAAFLQALNTVAQSVYGNAAIASVEMMKKALSGAQNVYDKRLTSEVKKIATRDSVLAEDPRLNNSALQPVVEALQSQFILKNPNATPSEIKQQITNYFDEVGIMFAPKPVEPKGGSKNVRKEEDWSVFLGTEN